MSAGLSPTRQTGKERMWSVWAAVCALLVGLWLFAQFVSSWRAASFDFAAAFFLKLLIVGGLWRVGSTATQVQRFWRHLAAAWTLTITGDLVWGLFELSSGGGVPTLTWIDSFYILRYWLLFLAFWMLVVHTLRWSWLGSLLALVVSAALAWFGLFSPSLAGSNIDLAHFLGVAIYPILDGLLLFVSFLSWRQTASQNLRVVLGLIVLAMVAFAVANWINFGVRLVDLEASSLTASTFWLLSDIFVGLAIFYFARYAPRIASEVAAVSDIEIA